MSTTIKVITILVILADLAFCIITGIRKSKVVSNADDYFIAGKKTNTFFLTMSAFSSLLGAGLFMGQCGRGAMYGLSAYWQLLGEGVIAGIVMALLLGPFLSRFKYYSMAHFIGGYICGDDKNVRRVAGIANLFPNVFWAGSQIMGISYVIQNVTGIDYRVVALICGIVFIFYTMMGGIESVLVTDALHGMIAIVSAVCIVVYSLKLMNFDIGSVGTAVKTIDPKMWTIMGDYKPIQIVTAFMTGFLGTLANPIYWNRAFAAKDAKSCRNAYTFAFTVGTILPICVIMIGIFAFTMNPDVGDQALVWIVTNKMPAFLTVLMSLAILAATLSSADTHLNCSAANMVADIIDPEGKLPTEKTLKYSRISTVVAGIIAIVVSMSFPSIYELANFGYTVCGGVLVPFFAIGLLMKDRTCEEHKSKLTTTGALCGIGIGILVAILFQAVPSLYAIMGGGILPAVIATIAATLIGNLFGKKSVAA
ncbi:MAG: sodium:solute symporter [Butyricicoccus sp.]